MKTHTLLLALLLTFSCKVSNNPRTSKTEIFLEDGVASWYGPGFHGKQTANGETFNTNHLTAAHRTLPFGTRVKVVNIQNQISVIVRINDRGPYANDRIIDLSKAAAKRLDIIEQGTGQVKLYLLDQNPEDIAIDNIKKPTYTIQLSSFSDEYSAKKEANKYNDGWIKPSKVGGKLVYRVFIGKFYTVESARKRKKDLGDTIGFIKQIEN
ncbi:septal ring lytic transglycosylase RlpA family protein [Ekhidna sp.]|uniref:septal ring lytic transglycosylase RlpA family protein n=1 Tax=Ekhidna sp. TaxID=2608089 RepID=UPI0032EF0B1D